ELSDRLGKALFRLNIRVIKRDFLDRGVFHAHLGRSLSDRRAEQGRVVRRAPQAPREGDDGGWCFRQGQMPQFGSGARRGEDVRNLPESGRKIRRCGRELLCTCPPRARESYRLNREYGFSVRPAGCPTASRIAIYAAQTRFESFRSEPSRKRDGARREPRNCGKFSGVFVVFRAQGLSDAGNSVSSKWTGEQYVRAARAPLS